jgi:hypothetical protein
VLIDRDALAMRLIVPRPFGRRRLRFSRGLSRDSRSRSPEPHAVARAWLDSPEVAVPSRDLIVLVE